MLYSEKLKIFAQAHPYEAMTVRSADFRNVMYGKEGGHTLVFLNGGMNTMEMWMDYAESFSRDCRVLLFEYPQKLRTNQELAAGMHAFFEKLGIDLPVFIGASDGGMDESTLKTLKRKYRFAPLMLWYMKHCNTKS